MADETRDKEDALLETPEVETPQADVTPEADAPPDETPAPPDSTDVPTEDAEPEQQKTPEQRADDAAHWQTKYQEEKEHTKVLEDSYAEAMERLKELGTPNEAATEQQEPPQQVQRPQQQDDFNIDEINEQLRDNPMLGWQAMSDAIERQMAQKVASVLDERDRRIRYEVDKREADKTLNAWAQKVGATPEDVHEAHDYFAKMGIKGSPVAMAQLTINHLNSQLTQKHIASRAAEAAAAASQKAKRQALTKQPEALSGDQPGDAGPRTVQDAIQSKFGMTKARTAEDALLGG